MLIGSVTHLCGNVASFLAYRLSLKCSEIIPKRPKIASMNYGALL